MSEWSVQDIVKTVLAPILGIVGGWITASLKIATRMTLLEKDVFRLTKKQSDDHTALDKEHKEKFTSLSSGFQLALTSQRDDLEESINRVRVDLEDLEKSYNNYTRSSHHDFANNEEFRRFTEDWQRQCQKIQRTLGQIEGMMQRETLLKSTRTQGDSDPSPASEESHRTRR